MRFIQLTNEEKAATGGFTHRLDLSYRDIPAGIAVNTSYTWNTLPLPKLNVNDVINRSWAHLTTPLQDVSDAAFNTSTLSVGLVTGGVAALIAAFEANLNGTEVIDTIPGVATPAVPVKNLTAGNQVTVTLNSMAAKTLSDLDKGQIYVLFEFHSGSDQSVTKAAPFGSGYS